MLIPATITYSIANGIIRETSRTSMDVEPVDVANHLCAFLRQREWPLDIDCCEEEWPNKDLRAVMLEERKE